LLVEFANKMDHKKNVISVVVSADAAVYFILFQELPIHAVIQLWNELEECLPCLTVFFVQ
jgi:hypothetical protein